MRMVKIKNVIFFYIYVNMKDVKEFFFGDDRIVRLVSFFIKL